MNGVMYMTQKAKKKNKMRHAEYYAMQYAFDNLYADSQNGEIFGHLIELISAPNNIKLAFRNIKSNDGSHTAKAMTAVIPQVQMGGQSNHWQPCQRKSL